MIFQKSKRGNGVVAFLNRKAVLPARGFNPQVGEEWEVELIDKGRYFIATPSKRIEEEIVEKPSTPQPFGALRRISGRRILEEKPLKVEFSWKEEGKYIALYVKCFHPETGEPLFGSQPLLVNVFKPEDVVEYAKRKGIGCPLHFIEKAESLKKRKEEIKDQFLLKWNQKYLIEYVEALRNGDADGALSRYKKLHEKGLGILPALLHDGELLALAAKEKWSEVVWPGGDKDWVPVLVEPEILHTSVPFANREEFIAWLKGIRIERVKEINIDDKIGREFDEPPEFVKEVSPDAYRKRREYWLRWKEEKIERLTRNPLESGEWGELYNKNRNLIPLVPEVRELFPVPEGKKVLWYLPTFDLKEVSLEKMENFLKEVGE